MECPKCKTHNVKRNPSFGGIPDEFKCLICKYKWREMKMEEFEPTKILHLTLKKKWFDLIKSGEKTEEYREYKPYWIKRLVTEDGNFCRFDFIRFRNGYRKDSPFMDVVWKGCKIEYDLAEAERFVISLGPVICHCHKKEKNL